jgi:hypothetical protein
MSFPNVDVMTIFILPLALTATMLKNLASMVPIFLGILNSYGPKVLDFLSQICPTICG